MPFQCCALLFVCALAVAALGLPLSLFIHVFAGPTPGRPPARGRASVPLLSCFVRVSAGPMLGPPPARAPGIPCLCRPGAGPPSHPPLLRPRLHQPGAGPTLPAQSPAQRRALPGPPPCLPRTRIRRPGASLLHTRHPGAGPPSSYASPPAWRRALRQPGVAPPSSYASAPAPRCRAPLFVLISAVPAPGPRRVFAGPNAGPLRLLPFFACAFRRLSAMPPSLESATPSLENRTPHWKINHLIGKSTTLFLRNRLPHWKTVYLIGISEPPHWNPTLESDPLFESATFAGPASAPSPIPLPLRTCFRWPTPYNAGPFADPALGLPPTPLLLRTRLRRPNAAPPFAGPTLGMFV